MAKGHIEVNEAVCKGCELCITVCPHNLIEMADYYNAKGYHPAILADVNQQCTGCMLCAMMCPDAGITVYRNVKKPKSVLSIPVSGILHFM